MCLPPPSTRIFFVSLAIGFFRRVRAEKRRKRRSKSKLFPGWNRKCATTTVCVEVLLRCSFTNHSRRSKPIQHAAQKNIPDRLALGKANVVVRCCCAPSGGEKGNKKRSQSSSCLSLLCAAILFPFRLDAGCLCVFYPLGVERERKRLLKLDSFFDAIDRIRPRLWGRRPLYNSFPLFSLCVMAENGM